MSTQSTHSVFLLAPTKVARFLPNFLLLVFFALAASLGASGALAAKAAPASKAYAEKPDKIVDETATAVFKLAKEARGYFDKDPERFYQAVDKILDGVIDYRGFARSVMGRHANKKRFAALNKKQQAKLTAQIDEFVAILRNEMIRTYSKAFLTIADKKAKTLPMKGSSKGKKSVSVVQHISGKGSSQPIKVTYKMRRVTDGKGWKLRNLTIDSVNLGRLYRGKFYDLMKSNGEDIDKVLRSWQPGAN